VSLVANYRAQFNRIIQASSFKELVDKLSAKKDQAMGADTAQAKRASQR
jgi:hypothetical protein